MFTCFYLYLTHSPSIRLWFKMTLKSFYCFHKLLYISAIDFIYIKQVLDHRLMSFQWKFRHLHNIYDGPLVLLNKAFLNTELSFSVILCLQSLFIGL